MARPTPQSGIDLLKSFETFRAVCYDDKQPNVKFPRPVKGVPTWGWGDTRDLNGVKLTPMDVGVKEISRADADTLLAKRLVEFEDQIEDVAGAEAIAKLTDNEYGALVCFIYNVGAGNGKKVLDLIGQGAIMEAPNHMELYNKSGGEVLGGLIKRRKAEIALYNTPDEGDDIVTGSEAATGKS